jgi:molecular chaperone HtpG
MRLESEVNLYCKKVLIQAKAKDLFPEWLRFLRGVVDSEDLPLNISRETMQDTSLIKKLNQVLTGRFIKFLDEQSEKDPANYEKFYQQYSRFLKEGVTTDFNHREALAKLLRFETSSLPKEQKTSFADYVKRMPADQKEIYYLLAPDRAAAEASPYYEAFAAKKYEVLFLNDPWDEFVMEHLHEFDSKPLRAAEKAEITVDSTEKISGELGDADAEALAKWMKEKLGERVAEVKASKRLVGSPAVIIDPDKHMTASMRRILKAAQHESKTSTPEKQNLEFNTRHNLILRLQQMRQTDEALAAKVAEQLYDNACVAAGLLEDPRSMLKRLNELLEQVLSGKP